MPQNRKRARTLLLQACLLARRGQGWKDNCPNALRSSQKHTTMAWLKFPMNCRDKHEPARE